jgi:hypothetical protein
MGKMGKEFFLYIFSFPFLLKSYKISIKLVILSKTLQSVIDLEKK